MTKIMLVEDDKSLREIYGVRLLAEGYEIVSAGDGEEALAMAVKEHPDLILSDVMMPKISGFDMLDILRATPETKEIKVIMMTALSSEDQRARGESLGANRYLVKSQVGIEDVVRTVHEILADMPVAPTPSSQIFGAPIPTMSINTQRPTPNTPSVQPRTITQSTPPSTTDYPTLEQKTTILQQPVQMSSQNPASLTPVTPIQGPVNLQPASQPTPTAAPQQEAFMPQPTAPFSSNPPASLGSQIVDSTQIPRPQLQTPAPGIVRPASPAPRPETVQPQPTEMFTVYNPAMQIQPQAQPTAALPQQPIIQDISSLSQPTELTQPVNNIASMMAQELNNNPTDQQNPFNPSQP